MSFILKWERTLVRARDKVFRPTHESCTDPGKESSPLASALALAGRRLVTLGRPIGGARAGVCLFCVRVPLPPLTLFAVRVLICGRPAQTVNHQPELVGPDCVWWARARHLSGANGSGAREFNANGLAIGTRNRHKSAPARWPRGPTGERPSGLALGAGAGRPLGSRACGREFIWRSHERKRACQPAGSVATPARANTTEMVRQVE